MASLQPDPTKGRVNGLARPSRFRGRPVRVARAHPVSLIAAGVSLYAVALVFPLFLKQVSPTVFAAALVGTALLLAGLHVRWTRSGDAPT